MCMTYVIAEFSTYMTCTSVRPVHHLQSDMQRAVQCRSMDQSTLVREAAVDLVGRFVLSRPELTSQYYDMLSERILVSKTPRL